MTTFCNKKVLFCSIYWPHPHTHPTLHEQEIPVEMVLTSIKQLDINKATGSDEIPMRLLKETANQIAPSLTMLFNKSLRLGIFPEEWKLANIVPIFKKGKRDFVENYRPIFLLPVISKVLERCVLAGQRATYPTSSAANSMAFKPVDLVWLSPSVSCITLAVNSTPVNKQTLYILTWVRHSTKWITPTYLEFAPIRYYCQTPRLVPFMVTGTQAKDYSSRSYFPRIARTNKYPNSVQKPTNSSGLCAESLGISKVPKRVVHFTFLSSGAFSATQPKYDRHSPLAY